MFTSKLSKKSKLGLVIPLFVSLVWIAFTLIAKTSIDIEEKNSQLEAIDGLLLPTPKELPAIRFEGIQFGKKTNFLLRDKLIFLSFGYTQCPDICPDLMNKYSQALTHLDETGHYNSSEIDFLFMTVDNEFDTLEHLARYAEYFDSRITTIRPSSEELNLLVNSVKANYKVTISDNGLRLAEHPSSIYTICPSGELSAILPGNLTGEQLAKNVLQIKRNVC